MPRAPSQDMVAGALFAAVGIAVYLAGQDYAIGNGARIGPGLMPRMLGIGLLVNGLVVALLAPFGSGEPVGRPAWRPLILVLISVLAFALAIDRLGLAAAGMATVLVAVAARFGARPVEATVLAVVVTAGTVLLFVKAVGLPIKVWP